ncbi:hypothetical protein ACJRO7_032276 [Eucalyptus globulus]|uniref:TIR domain-containing protein n=1 Tax=Eucalyptus globulus TaxID=34317 RepID=A0ABD3JME6_EUCGL
MVNSSGYAYEVFLIFRREDTRTGFTSFLYTSMIDAGIRVYKDDKELCEGEEFGPELLQAINQSEISIPIFSKGYASSVWCLKELVQMVEEEGEIAKTVTHKVFNELKKAYLVVSNNLVSVDHHVDKIMEKIGAHTSKTRIVGIHGMGGVGKTTIAKLIYNELSNKYNNCCFLSNIHEMDGYKKTLMKGLRSLKKGCLIKKVLLLLDDVGEKDHMDALIGKHDWFGKGSKVIITTRRKDVIHIPEVDWRYELTGLDATLSLQLFSKHAFRRDSPTKQYINRSKRAVHIARGLPLALEVIGSLLSGKNKKMWDATLKKLESVPHDEVQSKLKVSYDALDNRQQHIFLDIACRFIGYHKDIVVNFWDASELFSEVALEVLQNMSLIKIRKRNKLWMHDQLRDLGREIIRQKSEMKIEKQRWVWNPKEGLDLLRRHKEKEEVEALHLKFDDQHHFTYKDFKSLPNLTFLEVDDSKENFRAKRKLFWLKWPSYALPTNIFRRNSNLLPQLRWLSWHNTCPTFKIANFSMENLIILDLSWSEITHDWKGWNHMKAMKNLKVLDLAHCQCLKRTPNFSSHSNLERLILSGCESLIKIDKSIYHLKCLVFLDISNCLNLQRLPDELGRDLASLEYLSLRRCLSLRSLPETIGNLESLIELNISYTSIKELPISIKKLKNLKVVEMQFSNISKIHNAFRTMEKLEKIEIVRKDHPNERLHVEIGDCIYENKSLRILRLRGVRIHALPRLPESLIELELEELGVDMFPNLSNLANLKVLHLGFGPPNGDGKSDGLMEEPIPPWIGNLTKLGSLKLCFRETTSSTDLSLPPHPRRLPTLPSNLSSLLLFGCDSLCSMDVSNLRKLSSLSILYFAVAAIEGLGCLENLRYLDLGDLGQLAMLPDLKNLNKLRRIQVSDCGNLVEIQGELPRFLDKLTIYSCDSLQDFPDLFSLMGKTDVYMHIRNQMLEYTGGHRLQLYGFKYMQIPDLRNWNGLTILTVRDCHNLVEIQGELPQSLETLWIQCCESLQKLPDLSSLKGLREVTIERCGKLAVEEISRLCSEKSIEFVGEDDK